MIRLLDANVFITAANTYYGLDIVPVFWNWLEDQALSGTIASTDLVYEEIERGGGDLADWVKDNRDSLFRFESTSETVAQHVAYLGQWAESEGYKPHVIEDFMDGADPFLVGVAAEHRYIVVTLETPAGSRRRKVKIPDACASLGVQCEDTFKMMRSLGAQFA